MPASLFLDGLFNYIDPVIGFQLYIWLWVAILILAGIAHMGLYYGGWKPYGPLHGLYHSYKAGSNVAFIFDANLIGEMIAEREAKCIFDYSKWDYEIVPENLKIAGPLVNRLYSFFFYYPTAFLDDISPLHALVYKFGHVNKDVEIARKLEGGVWERHPSAVSGGVPLDIIIDADNWTIRTSPQHKAIERCALAWNEINPNDQIHSYVKFGKKLLTGEIICPEVSAKFTVPWTRIDSAFPLNLEENEWAGKKRQMAEQEYNADQITKNRIAWYILICGLSLAAIIFIGRLATTIF